MKKMKTIMLIAAMLLTVCLSSCMERREISGSGFYSDEKNDVTEIISEKMILDLRKMDVEKKAEITIDEVKQLISESEKLYGEYDEIVLLSGDKIAAVKMHSDIDVLSLSSDEYHDYLMAIKKIFVCRLTQLTQSSDWIHEEQLGLKYMMMKNLPIAMSLLYLNFDVESPENSLFRDSEYMFDYYWNNTRDYDIISMSRHIGQKYEDDFVNIFYCPKGTGRDVEIIFPTAEQQATLKAIEAREGIEFPK